MEIDVDEALEMIKRKGFELSINRIVNNRLMSFQEKVQQITDIVPVLKSWPPDLFFVLFRKIGRQEVERSKEVMMM